MIRFKATLMSLEPLDDKIRSELLLPGSPSTGDEAALLILKQAGFFYWRDEFWSDKPQMIEPDEFAHPASWRDVKVYRHLVEMESDDATFCRPADWEVKKGEEYFGHPDRKAWLEWNYPIVLKHITLQGPYFSYIEDEVKETQADLNDVFDGKKR